MKVKIKDLNGFSSVFGADCFLKNFPELLTIGVEVKQLFNDGWYYIIDPSTNWMYDYTCFFKKEDMKYLSVIYARKRNGQFGTN